MHWWQERTPRRFRAILAWPECPRPAGAGGQPGPPAGAGAGPPASRDRHDPGGTTRPVLAVPTAARSWWRCANDAA